MILTVLEKTPLETLAKERQLISFKHNGFWYPMDTLRDKNHLEKLWTSENSSLENLVKCRQKIYLVEFLKNKTVLVTGHTGFQGAWLSIWLKSLGSNVIGYALEPPTQPSLFETLSLEHDIKHIIGDLRDKEKLSNVIIQNKPEIVFHLGAQALVRKSYDDPLETFETNIMGTANLLESIRKCTSVKSAVIMTSDKCYENKKMSKTSYRR